MLVLIAEDHAFSRAITQKSVERLGHETVLAENGVRAWDLFGQRHPDVILSDWQMPELDGPSLCRRIREQPGPTFTYFILMSSLGEKRDIVAGMEAGVDDCLVKPLDRDELHLRLHAAARVMALHRDLADHHDRLRRLADELSQRVTQPPR